MDARADAALRMALGNSRDDVIAELQARVMQLQRQIASSHDREWWRLTWIHFNHVTSEFAGRQSDANAPHHFAERTSFQFVEIIAHARWGLAEPIVIQGRPHAAGHFNFRDHDLSASRRSSAVNSSAPLSMKLCGIARCRTSCAASRPPPASPGASVAYPRAWVSK